MGRWALSSLRSGTSRRSVTYRTPWSIANPTLEALWYFHFTCNFAMWKEYARELCFVLFFINNISGVLYSHFLWLQTFLVVLLKNNNGPRNLSFFNATRLKASPCTVKLTEVMPFYTSPLSSGETSLLTLENIMDSLFWYDYFRTPRNLSTSIKPAYLRRFMRESSTFEMAVWIGLFRGVKRKPGDLKRGKEEINSNKYCL